MTDEDGFTLIELLVAMVASSLLLGLLGWSISSLGRELNRSQRDDKIAELVVLAPTLKGMLEGAFADTTPGTAFEGTSDHLSAVISPPQALGPVGPVRLTLSIRKGSSGEGLYASFAPTPVGTALPAVLATPREMVGGFKAIEFSYLARDTSERLGTPKLIRIEFTAKEGPIPPITIVPKINSTGLCRFDPISMTCRP